MGPIDSTLLLELLHRFDHLRVALAEHLLAFGHVAPEPFERFFAVVRQVEVADAHRRLEVDERKDVLRGELRRVGIPEEQRVDRAGAVYRHEARFNLDNLEMFSPTNRLHQQTNSSKPSAAYKPRCLWYASPAQFSSKTSSASRPISSTHRLATWRTTRDTNHPATHPTKEILHNNPNQQSRIQEQGTISTQLINLLPQLDY